MDHRSRHVVTQEAVERFFGCPADVPGSERVTVGGDKGFDTAEFVRECRNMHVTPHVAQNLTRRGGSAIDRRTTQRESYRMSQKKASSGESVGNWRAQC